MCIHFFENIDNISQLVLLDMEKHVQFLNMSIMAKKANNINKNNLEFYWYGVWNIILSYWFESRLLVVPQYVISYELVNRDNNKISKSVKPDFVVTKYSYENDTLKEHIQLIVEIKRSSNEDDDKIEDDFVEISKQLGNQVSALFSNGKYEYVYGIIAIGERWKLYKYNFVRTNTHRKMWSNTSHNNTTNDYKKINKSKILNI